MTTFNAEYRVTGLVAAVATPIRENGEFNFPVIDLYIDHLIKNGVDQVFVNGGGGEGVSMTTTERKSVLEEWIKRGRKRLRTIMVHVGACSLKDAMEMASHAEKVGADAISSLGPFYFKPTTAGHLVEFCRRIAEAAPGLPFYYYHIPAFTGITVDIQEVMIQSANQIPTFRGLKFSTPEISLAKLCMESTGGKYNILYGDDRQLVGAVALQAVDGAIGTMYNYIGGPANKALKAIKDGDLDTASKEQFKLTKVWDAWQKYNKKYGGPISAQKALLQLVGVDVGPPLIPMTPFSQEDIFALKEELTTMGYFDWIK